MKRFRSIEDKRVVERFSDHLKPSPESGDVFEKEPMVPEFQARLVVFKGLVDQHNNKCRVCFKLFIFGSEILQTACCGVCYHHKCLQKQWDRNASCPYRCSPDRVFIPQNN